MSLVRVEKMMTITTKRTIEGFGKSTEIKVLENKSSPSMPHSEKRSSEIIVLSEDGYSATYRPVLNPGEMLPNT